MSYTPDKIYKLVGRDDKVAVLTFSPDSKAFAEYGESITVVFHYDQPERKKFERRFKQGVAIITCGLVKARYLGLEMPTSKVEQLLKTGIYSNDIQTIFPSPWSHDNVYYKKEKRTIRTIELPIRKEPKGRDYDWKYGFYKKLISDGSELTPYEMDLYLGMRCFFEPDEFSDKEKSLLFENGTIKESIEKLYLEIKSEREITLPYEEERLEELSIKAMNHNLEILKKELSDSGTNLTKLYRDNPSLCYHLMEGTYCYIPHRLNVSGVRPIFLDWQGYLHVFTRHVEEFSLNKAFNNKDKFLWNPNDVIPLMDNVIQSIDREIQDFWRKNENARFSKYGSQSIYFEGDYYTFHIESDGRLSTFYKSEKETEDH